MFQSLLNYILWIQPDTNCEILHKIKTKYKMHEHFSHTSAKILSQWDNTGE